MLAFRSNHAASFIAGAAVIGLGLLLASPASTTFPAGRFVFGPHPRDLITIREGTPFVVPPGKVFVALSMGNTSPAQGIVKLRINGVARCAGNSVSPSSFRMITAFALPRGFVAPAGSAVEVTDGLPVPDDGRAWGYLAPDSTGYSPDAISPRLDYTVRPSATVAVDASGPLVVPPSKVFVLTGLGLLAESINGLEAARFQINGVNELVAVPDVETGFGPGCTVMVVPEGVSAPSGAVLSVAGHPSAVAWGYFADV